MKTATEVVRRRIDALGTKEPTILQQGSNRIVVQVPGLQDPQQLKNLIGKTAKLESSWSTRPPTRWTWPRAMRPRAARSCFIRAIRWVRR